MSNKEIRRRRKRNKKEVVVERQVYSIEEFCVAHHMCRASFYNLKKNKKAPAIMEVGGRRLISNEAAAAWREAMAQQ